MLRCDSGCASPVFDEKGAVEGLDERGQGQSLVPAEGLFAKYVVALVGLVVFVLAVNGALEPDQSSWHQDHAADAMGEKRGGHRQAHRAVDVRPRAADRLATRASSTTTEQRRADYAQLLNQVPAVYQLTPDQRPGRERCGCRGRPSRSAIMDFSRDLCFTETLTRGASFAAPHFREERPFMSLSLAHSDYNAGVTVAEIDLSFPNDFLGDAEVGKATGGLYRRRRGPGCELSKGSRDRQEPQQRCRRSRLMARRRRAGIRQGHGRQCRADRLGGGAEARLARVLRAADRAGAGADPRPTGADRAFDRARPRGRIIAGTIMARRMLVPITAFAPAPAASARRRFCPPHRGEDRGRAEELASQFNSMAGQLAETYSGLEGKVKERTRDLAQSINELKGCSRKSAARSPPRSTSTPCCRRSRRALEITHADAVLDLRL